MTIKYTYKCNSCSHNYIEQRGKDEPNPFFTTCNLCLNGTYEETSVEVISLEPERTPGPVVEIVETEELIVENPTTETIIENSEITVEEITVE